MIERTVLAAYSAIAGMSEACQEQDSQGVMENYTDITHLTEIRDAEKLRALIGDSSYSPDYDPAEVRDLVNKVHAILQGAK